MSEKEITRSSKLHCNIDEKAFSRALFLCRLFTGCALVYLAIGSLLYWREFLVNTASFGFAHAVPLAFGLAGAELFIGLVLMLGWYTRLHAAAALLLAFICAIIFFAGQYNAVFVALCILFCAPLGMLLWMGPGAISLDYKRHQNKIRRLFLRGKL